MVVMRLLMLVIKAIVALYKKWTNKKGAGVEHMAYVTTQHPGFFVAIRHEVIKMTFIFQLTLLMCGHQIER